MIEVASETLAGLVRSRTVQIAAIPAPTGGEAARAGLVAGWWHEDGWADVHVDDAGNVWALARPGEGGAVVLAAHLDTVFAADVSHEVEEQDGRLLGPGVGDDSVAVAALSAVGTMLAQIRGRPVWLLATVGEEGLGNLRGIVAALDGFNGPVAAVLAVEGNYLGRVSAVGVGSVRWRARLSGPGGHAWEAAGAPSAVHAAAGIIGELATLVVPGARTAVNVGRIVGGEAINARARECWFELDIRADDPAALADLEARARTIMKERVPDGIELEVEELDIRADAPAALADLEARARTIMEANVPDGIELDLEELGRRPAGSLDPAHPLVRAAAGALEAAGLEPSFVATSTDANAAHARGIPAVAVGVTTGGGEHTPQEWIDVAPIALGLSVLAATVTRFEEAAG